MIDIDTSDPKEQRNFGLVMAAAIVVLGLIRWGLHWRGADGMPTPPYYYVGVSGVLIVLGLLVPRALQPFFVVWIQIATVLNWLVTHVVLSICFFFTVVPIGILIRLFGSDPMNRALDKDAVSYWQDAENQSVDPERYTKQF